MARFDAALYRFVTTVLRPVVAAALGLRVTGREHLAGLEGGFITVSNHVHPLDCAMLACQHRGRTMVFTAARANFHLPVAGFLVTHLGSIPVPRRGDPRDRARFEAEIAQRLAAGDAVHFFPEGDLVPYDTTLREFRPGAFAAAARCGVPVVPALFTYGPRPWWRRRPPFRLRFLPPVRPDGADAAAARRLAERVRTALEQATASPPPNA